MDDWRKGLTVIWKLNFQHSHSDQYWKANKHMSSTFGFDQETEVKEKPWSVTWANKTNNCVFICFRKIYRKNDESCSINYRKYLIRKPLKLLFLQKPMERVNNCRLKNWDVVRKSLLLVSLISLGASLDNFRHLKSIRFDWWMNDEFS